MRTFLFLILLAGPSRSLHSNLIFAVNWTSSLVPYRTRTKASGVNLYRVTLSHSPTNQNSVLRKEIQTIQLFTP